jgi:hypothetical protein
MCFDGFDESIQWFYLLPLSGYFQLVLQVPVAFQAMPFFPSLPIIICVKQGDLQWH